MVLSLFCFFKKKSCERELSFLPWFIFENCLISFDNPCDTIAKKIFFFDEKTTYHLKELEKLTIFHENSIA